MYLLLSLRKYLPVAIFLSMIHCSRTCHKFLAFFRSSNPRSFTMRGRHCPCPSSQGRPTCTCSSTSEQRNCRSRQSLRFLPSPRKRSVKRTTTRWNVPPSSAIFCFICESNRVSGRSAYRGGHPNWAKPGSRGATD